MSEKEYTSIKTIEEVIEILRNAETKSDKSAEGVNDTFEYAARYGHMCGVVKAAADILQSRLEYINSLPN